MSWSIDTGDKKNVVARFIQKKSIHHPKKSIPAANAAMQDTHWPLVKWFTSSPSCLFPIILFIQAVQTLGHVKNAKYCLQIVGGRTPIPSHPSPYPLSFALCKLSRVVRRTESTPIPPEPEPLMFLAQSSRSLLSRSFWGIQFWPMQKTGLPARRQNYQKCVLNPYEPQMQNKGELASWLLHFHDQLRHGRRDRKLFELSPSFLVFWSFPFSYLSMKLVR